MSLLSSASEWSSEDQPTAKRQSTIRNKTVKRTTQFANLEDVNKFNSDNVERNERVNKMIDKITSLNKPKQNEFMDDDANSIPDFNPMITNYSNDPGTTMAKVSPTLKTNMNANTNVGINTLGYYNSVNSQRRPPQNINVAPTSGNYSNSDADLYTLSNYARS
jgi:hypothetical protein